MNFTALIHQISKRLPDKTAIIENDKEISYKQLWQTIETVSRAFNAIGVKDGDTAALILPNCKEFIYSFFALLSVRAIVVPLNPKLTVYELGTMLKTTDPKVIVTTAAIAAALYDHNPGFIKSRKIILLDETETLKKHHLNYFTFDKLYKLGGKQPALLQVTTGNKEIASINFTYRGYSYPLGAVLTHGNYLHGAVGYIRLVKPDLDQRFLLVMPMSHIFTLVGCVLVPLLRGATVVVMRNLIPSHIFKAVEEYKIDFLVGVPTFYQALLSNHNPGKYNLASLKYAICGADYLSPEFEQEITDKLKLKVMQGYGLTETLPIICNPKNKSKLGSLGVPGHEVKVKIVDDIGKEVKHGQIGEILIGGPTVMYGYYSHPKETAEVLKDGWLYTGDLGHKDKDGYIYFEGLKKEIVKVGGNTIDLHEIKKIFLLHPAVSEAYIYPKPNKLWGKVLEAEVFVKKDLSEKDLKIHCNKYLAPYKMPGKIKVIKI